MNATKRMAAILERIRVLIDRLESRDDDDLVARRLAEVFRQLEAELQRVYARRSFKDFDERGVAEKLDQVDRLLVAERLSEFDPWRLQ